MPFLVSTVAVSFWFAIRVAKVLVMESNGWMEPHYLNPGYPYPNSESFMNFFEGLTHAPVSYTPPAGPLLDQVWWEFMSFSLLCVCNTELRQKPIVPSCFHHWLRWTFHIHWYSLMSTGLVVVLICGRPWCCLFLCNMFYLSVLDTFVLFLVQ